MCAIVDDSSMSDDALCCNLAGRVLRLAELTPDLASLKPPATQIFTEEHARENDKKFYHFHYNPSCLGYLSSDSNTSML